MAFEGLPEELMTLILVKLPVKSLLQFKCVRKSWYSLIKSPQFIHLHLTNRSSSSDCFIIRRLIDQPHHVLSFHSYETLANLGNEINIPFSIRYDSEYRKHISLYGPCNGLVCITNHYDQIIICNPALREFRSLFVPPSFGDRRGYHVDSVAFGSDPNTGEYKVVMIGVPYDNSAYYDPDIPDEKCINYSPDDDMFDDREVLVYNFSTDSWRETAVVIPTPYGYSDHAITLNGSFHWFPSKQPNYVEVIEILTFHISDEVTDSIPLPGFEYLGSCYIDLFVSSKSQLALIVRVDRDGDLGPRFDIIVMTEYGVQESWTRLFQIGPLSSDFCTPIAFWDEQQLLLLTSVGMDESQLVSCDLQHQNVRRFPIYGDLSVNPYSESLVSVNGIGESII